MAFNRVVVVEAQCDRCGKQETDSGSKYSTQKWIAELRRRGWMVGKHETLCRKCRNNLPKNQTDLHTYNLIKEGK